MPPEAPRTATLEAYFERDVSKFSLSEDSSSGIALFCESICTEELTKDWTRTWLAEAEKARFWKRLKE